MISGDSWGPKVFLTFVLQLRKNPGNNLRKTDLIGSFQDIQQVIQARCEKAAKNLTKTRQAMKEYFDKGHKVQPNSR